LHKENSSHLECQCKVIHPSALLEAHALPIEHIHLLQPSRALFPKFCHCVWCTGIQSLSSSPQTPSVLFTLKVLWCVDSAAPKSASMHQLAFTKQPPNCASY
jgi:hypothetical protein